PIPDVVGLSSEEAIKIIDKTGLTVEIQKTAAPKNESSGIESRVIRQKQLNQSIELVVSYF
ncbi:MAG: PASTA domain-containing protein, partial [Thermotaleaceae bacterium]